MARGWFESVRSGAVWPAGGAGFCAKAVTEDTANRAAIAAGIAVRRSRRRIWRIGSPLVLDWRKVLPGLHATLTLRGCHIRKRPGRQEPIRSLGLRVAARDSDNSRSPQTGARAPAGPRPL